MFTRNRKRVFVLGILFFLIAFSPMLWSQPTQTLAVNLTSANQAKFDAFVAELEAILQRQAMAWNRGDIKDFMAAYWQDDRLTFCSGGQITRGWEKTLQRYMSKYPDRDTMGKLVFSDLESQELGPDSVLMLGTWKLEKEQSAQGNFSLIWKRIQGKWVIIHDHSSLKP